MNAELVFITTILQTRSTMKRCKEQYLALERDFSQEKTSKINGLKEITRLYLEIENLEYLYETLVNQTIPYTRIESILLYCAQKSHKTPNQIVANIYNRADDSSSQIDGLMYEFPISSISEIVKVGIKYFKYKLYNVASRKGTEKGYIREATQKRLRTKILFRIVLCCLILKDAIKAQEYVNRYYDSLYFKDCSFLHEIINIYMKIYTETSDHWLFVENIIDENSNMITTKWEKDILGLVFGGQS